MRGVTDLIEMLNRKEIDGFLINRITYYYYRHALDEHAAKYGEREFRAYRESPLHLSVKDFIGEKKTIGILIKDYDLYIYFKRYFEDNMLQIENCNAYRLNRRSVRWKTEIDEHHLGKSFISMLYPSLVLVGVIIVIGVVLEIRRSYLRKRNRRNCKEEEETLNEITIR